MNASSGFPTIYEDKKEGEIMGQTVDIDVYSSDIRNEIYSHERDENYFLFVRFRKGSERINLTSENHIVHATLVSNKNLIAQDVALEIEDHGCRLNIGNNEAYNVPAGKLKVEFKITFTQTDPVEIICPVRPLIVHVKKSTLNGADITEHSVGNVADFIRALPDLEAFLENPVPDDSVTEAKIVDGAVTEDKISDGAVTGDKIASNAVTSAKISDGAITLAKLGNIFDPIPLEGSHNLVDSGTQAALFNDTARATTVITGNLTTLSTLNTARQNDRIYTYLLAPGTLFTNQPAAYPVKVLFVNTTQIIIGGDGYVFTRDYNSTTETWSSITCPLKDLEARVTALEAVDTILSNALNGVSE